MDSAVDLAAEDRIVQFPHKHPESADLMKTAVGDVVAGRFDDNILCFDTVLCKKTDDFFCLGKSKFTAPCADPYFRHADIPR